MSGQGQFVLIIGTYTYKNKSKYTGQFQNNKKHGKGVYFAANGDKFEGNWENGKLNGECNFYLPQAL